MNPAPYTRGLLDTSVLIDYREGWPDPVRFITAGRQTGRLEISELSALALIAWCQDAAAVIGVGAFLTGCRVYRVSASISRRAFQIMVGLTPPVPLTPDDAIIAATALDRKLPLYTLDPARFAAVAGLTAVRPY